MRNTLYAFIVLIFLSTIVFGQSGPIGQPASRLTSTVTATGDTPGNNFKMTIQEKPPGAPTVALAGAGAGNVTAGVHRVKVIFVTVQGTTQAGTASATVTVADNTVDGKIAISGIPTGSVFVTGRRVYMTTAGGSVYRLLSNGTINDNSTTTLTADDSDATLGAALVAPGANTTANPFLSYSNNTGAVTIYKLTIGAGGCTGCGSGGTPGGSNTQFQFNNSSSFGGAAGLTYDTVLGMPKASAIIIPETTVTGTPDANTAWLSFDNATQKLTCTDDTGGDCMPAGGATPAGSDTQVQFNDSSAFGGDAGLTYNKTTDGLTAAGGFTTPGTVNTGNGIMGYPAFSFAGGGVSGNTGFNMGGPSGIDIIVSQTAQPSVGFVIASGIPQLEVAQEGLFGWSVTPRAGTYSALSPTMDTAFARNAAGLVEINNGTAGTFRDLKVRQHYVDATLTAGGTTGAQTINKAAGSVNFAAAASSLVVTSDKVTASSIVICTVQTNDTTLKSVQCVPASGSFTMYANAAATAETKVGFIVINQ
jgi:hypothetical protein